MTGSNPKINVETFYYPLVEQFLKAWEGIGMTLVLDTSVLWDKYCLIEVCLIWGGRSIPLGQSVLKHGSATVGYEDYRPVLETTLRMLPPGCQVRLLADRGFEHGAFIRWLRDHRYLKNGSNYRPELSSLKSLFSLLKTQKSFLHH
ncbi:MAG: hypothetical protein HWQ42_02355 [Nostoc sp. JL23]|nr:hypothetical protein [Nostoc sp. JL23]